jgi:hypothetical protein
VTLLRKRQHYVPPFNIITEPSAVSVTNTSITWFATWFPHITQSHLRMSVVACEAFGYNQLLVAVTGEQGPCSEGINTPLPSKKRPAGALELG